MMPEQSKDVLLHMLRNPSGWSDETLRDARTKAADELDRLWRLERKAQRAVEDLNELLGVGKK